MSWRSESPTEGRTVVFATTGGTAGSNWRGNVDGTPPAPNALFAAMTQVFADLAQSINSGLPAESNVSHSRSTAIVRARNVPRRRGDNGVIGYRTRRPSDHSPGTRRARRTLADRTPNRRRRRARGRAARYRGDPQLGEDRRNLRIEGDVGVRSDGRRRARDRDLARRGRAVDRPAGSGDEAPHGARERERARRVGEGGRERREVARGRVGGPGRALDRDQAGVRVEAGTGDRDVLRVGQTGVRGDRQGRRGRHRPAGADPRARQSEDDRPDDERLQPQSLP